MTSTNGRLMWIGVRPERLADVQVLETAQAVVAQGLEGDHFEGLPGGAGKRQVTLVREEDLLIAAERLGRDDPLAPTQLRRNLVLSGLPMDSLRACRLRIGDTVVLEVTGGCPPCDRMDETVGPGGPRGARRSHGAGRPGGNPAQGRSGGDSPRGLKFDRFISNNRAEHIE